MKKAFIFGISCLALVLSGCSLNIPSKNQSANQTQSNNEQNVNLSKANQNQNVVTPLAENKATNTVIPSNLRIYQDSSGFSFQYPKTMAVEVPFSNSIKQIVVGIEKDINTVNPLSNDLVQFFIYPKGKAELPQIIDKEKCSVYKLSQKQIGGKMASLLETNKCPATEGGLPPQGHSLYGIISISSEQDLYFMVDYVGDGGLGDAIIDSLIFVK